MNTPVRSPGLSRRQAIGGVALAGLSLAQGCGRSAADGARITVAAYPQIDAVIRDAAAAWESEHQGVKVQVVSRQYADHHTAMTTALSTAAGLPDVMALESSFVGRFSHGHGLEDLAAAPFDARSLEDRFVRFAFHQAVNRRGEIVALPTDIGPGTLLYRQDLLDRAEVDPSGLTRSWDSFVAEGVRIRQRTGAQLVANVHSLKDILIRSGLQPGQGLYFDHDSNVLVRSERFERAFELARQARSARLDARMSVWSNEWAEGFRRGLVVTELSGAWMVGQLSKWVAPATAGLWRAAQLPEQTYVSYGGTFYAMPRRIDDSRKTLAWSLIRHLTLDPRLQLQAFREVDAFPALSQALEGSFYDEPLAFLGGQPARRLWRDAAQRIAPVAVHKQNSFADEVVGTELDNVLERGKTIRAALADAQRVLEQRARR